MPLEAEIYITCRMQESLSTFLQISNSPVLKKVNRDINPWRFSATYSDKQRHFVSTAGSTIINPIKPLIGDNTRTHYQMTSTMTPTHKSFYFYLAERERRGPPGSPFNHEDKDRYAMANSKEHQL